MILISNLTFLAVVIDAKQEKNDLSILFAVLGKVIKADIYILELSCITSHSSETNICWELSITDVIESLSVII